MILLKIFITAVIASAFTVLPVHSSTVQDNQTLTSPASGLTTLNGAPLYILPAGTSAL